ncbi:MAG: DNA repair protein RecN [Chloroflexota bacterium]
MSEPGPAAPAAGRLLELTVTDLALLERVRIAFAEGLNVITGETGAGKSLLIDALGLALGARADPGLVRHGAEAAQVEALFDRLPEPLVCVRDVAASGRSVARIDDETVTAARLAATAGPLVEIHGQHEQARLLEERWQRDLLDSFGGHDTERAGMASAVEAWRENEVARAALAVEPRELERRIALVEHEAAEIAAARIRPREVAETRERLAASRHGEAIARGAGVIVALLAGDEGEATMPAAREQTARAAVEAATLGRLDARYEPLSGRLAGLAAELEDAAFEARSMADAVEHDATALAMMEERLSFLFSLERKYGTDAEGLLGRAEQAADEVERLRGLEAEGIRRSGDATRLLEAVAVAAEALSARRRATAVDLGSRIERALGDLGLAGTGVEIAVGRRPAGREEPAVEVDGDAVAFDAAGIDVVVFRIAPNPGEPSRPLAKIASGGELSRIALAIEEGLVDADATPTLVFDEIDAGIGGRSADPVGRTLWVLGGRHQVLCVTHLPQIAAHADAHFAIHKVRRDGRTVTEVRRLDDEGRVGELAAMLGGAGGGPAAEASARELLERAARFRVSRGVRPPPP